MQILYYNEKIFEKYLPWLDVIDKNESLLIKKARQKVEQAGIDPDRLDYVKIIIEENKESEPVITASILLK